MKTQLSVWWRGSKTARGRVVDAVGSGSIYWSLGATRWLLALPCEPPSMINQHYYHPLCFPSPVLVATFDPSLRYFQAILARSSRLIITIRTSFIHFFRLKLAISISFTHHASHSNANCNTTIFNFITADSVRGHSSRSSNTLRRNHDLSSSHSNTNPLSLLSIYSTLRYQTLLYLKSLVSNNTPRRNLYAIVIDCSVVIKCVITDARNSRRRHLTICPQLKWKINWQMLSAQSIALIRHRLSAIFIIVNVAVNFRSEWKLTRILHAVNFNSGRERGVVHFRTIVLAIQFWSRFTLNEKKK